MTTQVKTIKYTKSNGGVSTRKVLLRESVSAYDEVSIDLTELSEPKADAIVSAYAEYEAYVQAKRQQILGFNDWIENSQLPISPEDIHWRQFLAARTEILD